MKNRTGYLTFGKGCDRICTDSYINTEKKKVYLAEADRDVFMAERNERKADRRWLWSGRNELRRDVQESSKDMYPG